jgi:hypothetical protein
MFQLYSTGNLASMVLLPNNNPIFYVPFLLCSVPQCPHEQKVLLNLVKIKPPQSTSTGESGV